MVACCWVSRCNDAPKVLLKVSEWSQQMNGNFMLLTVKRLQDVVTVLLLIQRTVECSFLTKTIETAPNQRRLHKKLFCCTSPPGNVYDTLYSLLFCEICHHFLVFTIL